MKLKIMLSIRHESDFFKPLFKEIDLGVGIAPGMFLYDSLWGDKREVVIDKITIDTSDASKYSLDLWFQDFRDKEEAENYYNLAVKSHDWSRKPID